MCLSPKEGGSDASEGMDVLVRRGQGGKEQKLPSSMSLYRPLSWRGLIVKAEAEEMAQMKGMSFHLRIWIKGVCLQASRTKSNVCVFLPQRSRLEADNQEQPSQHVCMDSRAPLWSRSLAPSPVGRQMWQAFPLSFFVSKMMRQLHSFKTPRALSTKKCIYNLSGSKIWPEISISDTKANLESTQASNILFIQHIHLEN